MEATILHDPIEPQFDEADRLLFDALNEAEHACGDPKLVVSKALSVIQLYAGFENQEELCGMLKQLANEIRRVYLDNKERGGVPKFN